MKKIPTLFIRDPDDMRRVTRDVHPECKWVLDGEGVPTRKYDGTCLLYDGTRWWARREVKPGKPTPPEYSLVETDAITGKSVGWEPAERSSFFRYLDEAARDIDDSQDEDAETREPGTFELIGPKVNGNPERLHKHKLVRHAQAERLTGVPHDYDGLVAFLAGFDGEGIVWHNQDGRMAKLKRRDFPRTPVEAERATKAT